MTRFICYVIKGECPMCVVATSGTTVLGSFDPLDEVADICERYNVWLHCDVSTIIMLQN